MLSQPNSNLDLLSYQEGQLSPLPGEQLLCGPVFFLPSTILPYCEGFIGTGCECHVGAGDRRIYNQRLVVTR